MYKRHIKRPMDFFLALCAIIVLSPLLAAIAALVKIKLGSPVIFMQKRPGLNEKIFTLYKFRTMTDNRDENGKLLPDSARLTNFGRLLRSTSLDELPELFNILKGEMSVVGPRPQLVKDMAFMTMEQKQRHNALPGLSGWAQVNGRNDITWEEKLALDLEYIKKITFLGDWKIILMTFTRVFKREGISTDNMDTTEDFGDYLLRMEKITKEEYSHTMKRINVINCNGKN